MSVTTKIEAKLNQFYAAFNGKDWQAVATTLADDFNYYTDNCVTHTKEEFLGFMEKDDWQGSGFNLTNLSITALDSSEIAFANYTTEFEGKSKNQTFKFTAIETVVFKLIADDWFIIHFHTSNKF